MTDEAARDEQLDRADLLVRLGTVITLGVVLVAAIAGLTVTAVFTDRNLARPEAFTFVIALALAGLGGWSIGQVRRRHRWRIEREDVNGDHGRPPR